jgi:2-polyprenyl-6-methoxyphenol hydroxylase-like FAD-dependent oxidoreductase
MELSQHSHGVEVTIRQDGEQDQTVRAQHVVGADGIHSTVRESQGIPFPGKPVVRSVMLAEGPAQ